MSKPTAAPELTAAEQQQAQAHARMAAASYLRGLSVPGYDLESVMIAIRVVTGEDQGQEVPEGLYQEHVVELMQGIFGGLATVLGSQYST